MTATTTTEQTLRELLTVMWLDGHIELTDGPDDIADVADVGEAAISAALDKKPDSWALRELYADWLEVQRNPRCESQRWMVDQGSTPVIDPDEYAAKFFGEQWLLERRGSFDGQSYDSDREPPPVHLGSLVPDEVFYKLSMDQRWVDNQIWMWRFPTRTAAELDLHNALIKAGEITCEEVTA